ncbi:COX15/CtaA family protein [Luminiphilus sp. nBUS_07]|uniref:COX15/CtaA family protein n=1 Tax=Luminiphilus sp. nBUS_07 TaxID=3395314 RepID=UPI003EC06DBD
MYPHVTDNSDRWIARWLTVCAVVIFGMILLGGVTRLTDSGLSMVEWQPIMGAIPPLTAADWDLAFTKYQQFPEYQKVNYDMDLAGFKVIFMYEYLHRVLGRLIGVLYLFPMVFFMVRGMVRRPLKPKLLLLFVLGGCQGLLGWYMVKSGLVDRPDVSQYRLTAHLGLAVLVYGYMVWLILQITSPHRQIVGGHSVKFYALAALVYLMILSGGFVAGTDAGYSYPTWPLMGDHLIPPSIYAEGWISAFEQVTTIQFNHRLFAYGLVLLVASIAITNFRGSSDPRVKWGAVALSLALVCQVTLGVSTLLTHVAVPIAAAHQGGAVVLLTAVLFFTHARLTERSRF